MVCAVTAGHAAIELLPVPRPDHVEAMYFVPASLYFLPVLYSSLHFGREGAIPTAAWSALLAVPNVLLWHDGLERAGEAFQMVMMILLAVVVAWRVDKEIHARETAERSERARGLSDLKYRALFDAAAEPILVLEGSGVIQEANAAAGALLGRTADSLRGNTTREVFGKQVADALCTAATSHDSTADLHLTRPDGRDVWLEPLCTSVPTPAGEVLAQVLLQDVTERRGFQHYAREITRAQEDERQRIAQELHDVSVQSAVLICRRLDATSEAVESGDKAAVTRTIAEARHAAESMADELRRFSRDLRPLILEDLGLVPALKRLVTELRERSHTHLRFEVKGVAHRLDPRTELVLFRIGQEALRNAEHHASATSVSVRLSFGRDAVRLSVVDNGVGFVIPPLTTLVNAGRLGVLGMQERALLLGGRCQIQSNPGEGTRVTAEIPVGTSAAASKLPLSTAEALKG